MLPQVMWDPVRTGYDLRMRVVIKKIKQNIAAKLFKFQPQFI